MGDYRPNARKDDRGEVVELFNFEDSEMLYISLNPGAVRGNHYHKKKRELLCVLKGEAVFRLRNVKTGEVREYNLSGENLHVIEIQPFWTHRIKNIGEEDTFFLEWKDTPYNPEDPDSFQEEV